MNTVHKLHMYHRFWRHRYWAEESRDIKFLLATDMAGRTALDIGANIGIYSYWMSGSVGETGRVFAFEPQPELAAELASLKNSFHLDNLVIVSEALSNNSGKQVLYRSHVGAGGASFHQKDKLKVLVDKTTLDEFVKTEGITEIAFIKCDVEGHELNVFMGGRNTLSKFMPYILFECHHEHAKKGELFSYMESLGFDGFFFVKTKKIHYSKYDEYPYAKPTRHHRNYIFGPAEEIKKIL